MKKFIADKSFFELFPNAKLGVVLIKDIKDNPDSSADVKKLLRDSYDEAEKYLVHPQLSQNPVIAVWRDAFTKFKTKKKARSSIEALLKRVEKDQGIGSINTLVDIYNSASLKYAIPCGAEDIDSFVGDLRLTVTEGDDEFYPIGSEENSPTLEGELCYLDDAGAVCRCFNWRDGQRTMITEETKNAFLIMEQVDETRLDELEEAISFIAENMENELDAEITTHFLDKDNSEIEIA